MNAFAARGLAATFVATLASTLAPAASAASPTLDKILARGAVALGYRESSIPFSFLDGQQRPVGFSIDLCGAVVDALRAQLKRPALKVEYVAVNASNRIPLLTNGTIDLECGSTTNTRARQQQVAFSLPTFVAQPRWLVLAASGIANASQLRGRTVVITQGSVNHPIALKINQADDLGLTVLTARDQAESLLMLRNGRAAAFFEDDILQAGLVANAGEQAVYRTLPETYGGDTFYGLMLRKGDAPFKSLVDGVIRQQMASGEFAARYERWFERPIPPRNETLALPMSRTLRGIVAAPRDVAVD